MHRCNERSTDMPENELELTPWIAYAGHREVVTRLISSRAAESLCVLGAGQCFDLDLPQLDLHFDRIALVDIAPAEMAKGLAHQGLSNSQSITTLGKDITESAHLFEKLKTTPTDDLIDQILDRLNNNVVNLDGPYDCVASTCIVSQLILNIDQAIGQQHPRFVELIQAVRSAHVQTMLKSLKPGGAGLLVTDFVSSVSLPELITTRELATTVEQALDAGNHFHGLHPTRVANVFDQKEIGNQLREFKISDPWRWAMIDRVYACIAFAFRKK